MKPEVGMVCTVDELGELFPATIVKVTESNGEVTSITILRKYDEDTSVEFEFESNGDGTYGAESFGVPYIGEAHSFEWGEQ